MNIRAKSVRLEKLEIAVRRAYQRGEIDAKTVGLLRGADPSELCEARMSIFNAMFRKMVDEATAAPLFPGDTSSVPIGDVLDNIGTWFAFTLLTDLGQAAALKELEQLTDAVTLGL